MYEEDRDLTPAQRRELNIMGELPQIRQRKSELLAQAAAIMGLPATAPTELIEAKMNALCQHPKRRTTR